MLATVRVRASSSAICSRSCAKAMPVTLSSDAGVDRHAREVVLAQLSRKCSSVMASGDGEDLRPRRHHLAHQLVAELDGGAHQVAIALFQNALFFAGFEQRLDIDGRLFFRADRLLGQRGHGEEEADEDGDGRDQPEQQADGPEERVRPAAARAVEQQRGQKLIAEDHHQHHAEHGLRDLGIGGPADMRSRDRTERRRTRAR